MLADNLTLGLVTLVALTAMSAACYYAVEEPARRYIRRRFTTRRPHRTAGNPGELAA
jgi:peptidoglycan/LPS O-acetylase OafA/YrhL